MRGKKCKSSMGFRMIVPVFGIILALVSIQIWTIWHNAIEEKNRIIEKIGEEKDTLKKEASDIASQNLQLALTIAAIDGVKEAVGLEDRERLIEIITPIINSIKKQTHRDIKVHFHLPPGRSFVRMWKLNKFGDDISGFRKTVVTVLRTGRPVYGIEAGRAGLAIRGVAPIFWEDSKKPVGSVEVFTSLNKIAQNLAAVTKEKNAIYGFLKVKATASAYELAGNIGRFSALLPPPSKEMKAILNSDILEKGLTKGGVVREIGDIILSIASLNDYRNEPIALYVRFIDIGSIKASLRSAIIQGITLSILGLILSILVTFFIIKTGLTQPLREALRAMNLISSGKMNMALPVEGSCEIQNMMSAANSIIYAIGHSIITLKDQSVTIDTISKNLKEAGDVLETGGADVDKKANEVAQASREAAEQLNRVALSTEEMATATNEIAKNVSETARVTNLAQEKAQIANNVIERLGESSQKIGEVIQVINSIAEQTNLLALNATIEAARAGEAGKGFAVVANEVKELASQTAKSTEDITNMIETIQTDTKEAINAVSEITNIVTQVNELANTIASAAEEQTATVSEIKESVDIGTENVKDVEDRAIGMAEQASEFAQIASMVANIQTAVFDLSDELRILADSFVVSEDALYNCEQFVKVSVFLKGMISIHQQWRQRVLAAILSGKDPDVETDPGACALGKWLSQTAPPTSEAQSVMVKVSEAHNKMHHSVIEVKEAIRQGKGGQAVLDLFEHHVVPHSDEVVDALRRLQQIYESREKLEV